MECVCPVVNTDQLPATFQILRQFLPTILRSKCFNDENKPFFREVLQTEVGHLFEHMLLEYMCKIKVSRGLRKVCVSGVTNWNWRRERYGTFNITIRVGREESEIFLEAFNRSMNLFNVILNSSFISFPPKTDDILS